MHDVGVSLIWPETSSSAGEAAVRMVATGRGLLKFVLGDELQRFRLLGGSIRWSCILLAVREDVVVGFAAIKRSGCGPYAPRFRDFVHEFGLTSGSWRWSLFHMLEWRGWRSDCYLYGLKVLPSARRQGVATALVEGVVRRAAEGGARSVELDVSDRHPGARALYVKLGFRVTRELRLSRLAPWLGFSSLCVMVRELEGRPAEPLSRSAVSPVRERTK